MVVAGALRDILPPKRAMGSQERGQGQVPAAHHRRGGVHQEPLCEGHDPEGLRRGV